MLEPASSPTSEDAAAAGDNVASILVTAMVVITQIRAYRDVEHINALFRARARFESYFRRRRSGW